MKPTIIILAALAVLVPATAASGQKKPKSNALTAAAKPFVITFGQSTTVSGRLTANPRGGQQLTLSQDPFPYGDAFLPLAQATTAGNGNYSFKLLPALNTNYRVTVGTLTANTGVRVRHAVSLVVSDTTPKRGQRVRFSGSVRPKHDGKIVRIQRQAPNGKWSTIRRVKTLTATGNRSRYTVRIRVFLSRKYRALFAGDGAHLTGTSPAVAETVH